ncbi:MAG TPA: acetyl-CoA C-acyltransferase [Phycisphaerales bacterium]|mgnify:CR=1 FL=1|nr:acetyl-CoA C-acyltransferase [Phycisphaerales bacterium]|tara:strand:- start:700 stop:1875 length:1176 start_codon:yes stop_codon:yes gene_type:complete
MNRSVILSAKRTPIGRFFGGLSRVKSPQLGAWAVEAALEAAPGSASSVDECIMGCVLQAGLGQNPARQAGLKAGLPSTLSAQTVNKVCGSGLQAVMLADQSIRAGDNQLVVAGGFENMTASPHFAHVRSGVKFGDTSMQDHMAFDGLTCAFEEWGMGFAAEHIAAKHGISREELDRYSAQSHQRAAAATESGWFNDEIVPLEASRIKQRADVTADEGIRADTTADGLAKLRPSFTKDGVVTAGNASQISDGAAALVIASEEKASELGCTPLATIIASGTAGVDPKEIFDAPAKGIKALLDSQGLGVDDIDLFEVNEAFAAQVLANIGELGISEDKLNICGGGMALGHPIGASGARVLTTLVHQMRRTDARRGVVSLCLGGGNAVSMLVERS